MLDLLERQWHTATIAAAIVGGEIDEWHVIQERFDYYLSGEEMPQTKMEEMRGLLGLPTR